MRIRAGSRPTMSSPLAALFLKASLLAAVLLQGCEFFSTKELAGKPSDIRPFAADFTTRDTLRFRVTESLVEPGSGSASQSAKSTMVLAKRILRFAKAPDSLQEGGGWITVSVAVDSDPAGTYKDRGLIRVRFDAAGATLRSTDSSSAGAGGARYFPLKAAARQGSDTAEFLVLPTAFLPGADWVGPMGVLEVSRTIEDVDTLDYGRHLEESWRVSETVRGGGRAVAQGNFWYGASGLLKAEQVWEIEGRASDGSPAAPRELRRDLVRL